MPGHSRELKEAEAVPDVVVPRLCEDQEENVVRQLLRDPQEVFGKFDSLSQL